MLARPLCVASLASLTLLAAACSKDPFGGHVGVVSYEMHAERFDGATATFTPIATPPVQGAFNPPIVAGGKLYLIGPLDTALTVTGTTIAYDPAADKWTTLPNWPTPRLARFTDSGTGIICAFGGWNSITDTTDRTIVDCLDTTKGTWSTRAPLPHPYQPTGVIGYQGKFYLLGGTRGDGASSTNQPDAWVYDPSADTFTALAPMPRPCGVRGAVLVGSTVYTLGCTGARSNAPPGTQGDAGAPAPDAGASADGGAATDAQYLASYDIAGNKWTALPPAPSADWGALDVLGTDLVAYIESAQANPTAMRYTPATQTWRAAADPPAKFQARTFVSFVLGGELYVIVFVDGLFATSNMPTQSGDVWRYDPGADAWAKVAEHATDPRVPLYWGSVVGSSAYVIGAWMKFGDISIHSELPQLAPR